MKSLFFLWCIASIFFTMLLPAQENAAAVQKRKVWRNKLMQTQTKSFRTDALAGMKDPDPVIRSFALLQYFKKYSGRSADVLRSMASDPDHRVAFTVFGCARALKDHKAKMEVLTVLADQGKVPEVKRLATSLTTFNFFRETRRLKDDPTHDHEVVLLKQIALPLSGWKFACDPMSDGHKRKVFAVDFPDKNWKDFRINTPWESQGLKGYDGIGWYRLKFRMPEEMKHNAVELHFEAVDECAWVWVNGVYVGQHDKGPNGWKTPFWIDVTKEIRWDAENVIAVRVQDTAGAGGIWKKVFVEILQ